MKKNRNLLMSSLREREDAKRGSALLLTIFFMILIFTLAVGFFTLIPQEYNAARKQLTDTQAFYVAEAGMQQGMEWLQNAANEGDVMTVMGREQRSTWPGVPSESAMLRGQMDNGWTWVVHLIPDETTVEGNSVGAYEVRGVALDPSGQTRRSVVAWVLQRSFAEYSWFYHGGFAGSNLVIYCDRQISTGAMHTNANPILWTSNNVQAYTASQGPPDGFNFAFSGRFTFASPPPPNATNVDANGLRYRGPVCTNSQEKFSDDFNYYDLQPDGDIKFDDPIQMPADSGQRMANAVYGTDNEGNPAPDYIGDPDNPSDGDAPLARDHVSSLFKDVPGEFRNGVSGPRHPATIQVHVNPDGKPNTEYQAELSSGIWIEGDVDEIVCSVVDERGEEIPYSATPTPDGQEEPNRPNVDSVGIQKIRIAKNATTWPLAGQPEGQARLSIYQVAHGESFDLRSLDGVTGSLTLPDGSTQSIGGNPILTSSDTEEYTVFYDEQTQRTQVYRGLGNGVIFTTGDINGLRGVIKGRKTFATMIDRQSDMPKPGHLDGIRRTEVGGRSSGTVSALVPRYDRKIVVNGELLRADTVEGEAPDDTPGRVERGLESRDMVGLVTYRLDVDDTMYTGPTGDNGRGIGKSRSQFGQNQSVVGSGMGVSTTPSTQPEDDIDVYASIYAGRSNDPWLSEPAGSDIDTFAGYRLAGGVGSVAQRESGGGFRLWGACIEGLRRWKGTGGSPGGGIDYRWIWDSSLNTINPPMFPAFNQFRVVAWEDERL